MHKHISDVVTKTNIYTVYELARNNEKKIVAFDQQGECVNTKRYTKLEDEHELTISEIIERIRSGRA